MFTFNGHLTNRGVAETQTQKKYDSEVSLLADLYRNRGIDSFSYIEGMFAIAVYDEKKSMLVLARDDAGVKPLYYRVLQSYVVFASEMKSLIYVAGMPGISEQGLASYLDAKFCSEPIFQDIHEVPPGSITKIRKGRIEINPINAKYDENTSFREKFSSSLQGNCESDVDKKGITLLSAGIDSSLIAAHARNYGISDAITIGYKGNYEEDERKKAKDIAKHLELDFHDVEVDCTKILDLLYKCMYHLEEPLFTPVSISTYCLYEAVKELGFSFALSGEGADELYCGYEFYSRMSRQRSIESQMKIFFEEHAWLTPAWRDRLFPDIPVGFNSKYCKNLDPLNSAREFGFRVKLPSYHLKRIDRLSMAASIEGRLPFLSRGVIMHSLNIPALERVSLGCKEPLFREGRISIPSKLSSVKKKFSAPVSTWLNCIGWSSIRELLLLSGYEKKLGIRKSDLECFLKECEISPDHHGEVWGMLVLFVWSDVIETW